MRAVIKRRMRTPQEQLQTLDKRLAKLGKEKRLTAETKKQIRDMRGQIPIALRQSSEAQKAATGAGNMFIRAIQMVFRHGNYPLPEI
jgi:hypothetical protein